MELRLVFKGDKRRIVSMQGQLVDIIVINN